MVQPDKTGVTVKSGSPVVTGFLIPEEEITLYGEYEMILSENTDNKNQTFVSEIIPRPDTELNIPHNQEIDGVKREMYFTLTPIDRTGHPIAIDELCCENITIYELKDNESTTDVIEKEKRITKKLIKDENISSLVANINTSSLDEGKYTAVADFNISSCDVCASYEVQKITSFDVREVYDKRIYEEKWGSEDASSINTKTETESNQTRDLIDLEFECNTDNESEVCKRADKIGGATLSIDEEKIINETATEVEKRLTGIFSDLFWDNWYWILGGFLILLLILKKIF